LERKVASKRDTLVIYIKTRERDLEGERKRKFERKGKYAILSR